MSVILSKVLALAVGLTCLVVAFLARFLGGLLQVWVNIFFYPILSRTMMRNNLLFCSQAALTIFGVVGGPMLGLYTLGMFVPSSNQKGVIVGFVLSLAFSSWIGFGQPKPPIPRLSVSTDGCGSNDTVTAYHGNDVGSLIHASSLYDSL